MAPGSREVVLPHDTLIMIAELVDYSDLPNLRLACKPLLEAVREVAIGIHLKPGTTVEKLLRFPQIFPNANSLNASRVQSHHDRKTPLGKAWCIAILKLCSAISHSLAKLDLSGCHWVDDKVANGLLRILAKTQPSKLETLILRGALIQDPSVALKASGSAH